MKRILAAFGPSDWFVILTGLALVGWLEVTKSPGPSTPELAAVPAASDLPAPNRPVFTPAILGPSTERIPPEAPDLLPETRKVFDEDFSQAPYFGAFAVANDGSWSWSSAYGTRAAAARAALAVCESAGARGCRIVAELMPLRGGEAASGRDVLSWSQAEGYRAIARGLGPRAFARSEDGAWGNGSGGSVAAAAADALSKCQESLYVHDAMQPMPCEVIAVWDDALTPP